MLNLDLDVTLLEGGDENKTEHYTFTLTNKHGVRFYGICLRSLFRGIKRNFNVGLRYKHCLCFITANPYLQLFKTLLQQIHSMALIEEKITNCRKLLDVLYTQGYPQSIPMTLPAVENIDKPNGFYVDHTPFISGVMRDLFYLSPAKNSTLFSCESVRHVPLLDVLGPIR